MFVKRACIEYTKRQNVGTMTDGEFIDALGGPRRVCELLRYDAENGGLQRIYNWRTRGIPSKVLLEHAAIWALARASLRVSTPTTAPHKAPSRKTLQRPAAAA